MNDIEDKVSNAYFDYKFVVYEDFIEEYKRKRNLFVKPISNLGLLS